VAEHYAPGLQKIFYKSTSGKSGVVIRVELFLSEDDDQLEASLDLKESFKFPGLYYFIYNFSSEIYLASFFEDGALRASQVYYIKPLPTTGEFKFGGYKGPSVINS